MSNNNDSPVTDADLSRVRELLVGDERRDLEALRGRFDEVETIYKRMQRQMESMEEAKEKIDRRLQEMEKGEEFISQNLAGAINLRNKDEKKREELIGTLTEDVEECLGRSVTNDRVKVAQTLAPAVDLILDNRKTSLRQAVSEKLSFGKAKTEAAKKKWWVKWAILGGVLLILLVMLILKSVGNGRWEKAVAALEAEPGIEVIDAEYSFFGKERLVGLRDPQAKDPLEILQENDVDPTGEKIRFISFLSQNTAYSQNRKTEEKEYFEELGSNIVGAVGDLAGESMNAQQRNLERMTQALFRVRFPEAAEKGAQIFIENDQWYLKGTLDEPLFSEVIEELPELKLTGEVNTEKLLNTTEKRLEQVRAAIGETTFIFLSGEDDFSEDGERQKERVSELAAEHEELVEKLGVPGAIFEVHALPLQGDSPGNRELEATRIRNVEAILKAAGVSAENIAPGVHDEEPQEGRVGVYINVTVDTGEEETGDE